MRYGKEENLLSNIFMSLEASATYWQIENTEGKWLPRVIRGSFLDTLQTAGRTKYSIPEPSLLWSPSML